jgi:hypothetical protein
MCIASYVFMILPSILNTAPFEPNNLCYLDYFKVEKAQLSKCSQNPEEILKIEIKDCATKKMIPAVVSCSVATNKYVIVFNELFEESDNSKRCGK